MINIFGRRYYIDFEVLDKFLALNEGDEPVKTQNTIEVLDDKGKLVSTEIITDEVPKHKEINGVRFQIISNLIEDLGIASDDDFDQALGSKNLEKMGLKFKLAYNTLIFYNILKDLD